MFSKDRAPTPSDDELDMMLAEGRLGGAAKDRIFDAVASRVRPRRRFLNLRGLLAAGLMVSAAATALLLVPRAREAGFGVKGGGGAPGPTLEISCAGGTLAACPIGSRLVFGVEGAESGYLAAYADPTAGGERIWYFSRDSQSPALAPVAGTQVAKKAILLGAEHAPGRYRVHVLVTAQPLSRAELSQGPSPIAEQQFDLEVVGGGLVSPF
jgi:hypothetical protein